MSNGRRIGNDMENEVCRALSAWMFPKQRDHYLDKAPIYDLPFRRRSTSVMPVEGHWRGQGDILHRPDVPFAWPFAVEVKKREGWELDGMFTSPKWPVWAYWRQAHEQAATARLYPLLVFRRARRMTCAMLEEDQAAELDIEPRAGPILYVRPASKNRPSNTGMLVICALRDIIETDPALLDTL